MADVAEHTPTPWKTVPPGHGHETEYLCVQIGESYTTLELKPQDARHIVRAVNAHDALVAACRQMDAVLKRYGTQQFDDLFGHDEAFSEALACLRTVLALAEGETP